jgi:tRNA pseudouridine55 synthase
MITKNALPESPDFTEGEVILIDKRLKWTSFDVIRKIQSNLRRTKIGHAGTLDPLATGLLILCTGRKTKMIPQFQEMPKEYTGTLELGAVTPSFDRETEINERFSYSHITPEAIAEAANSLTGEILQVPPQFSAIKVEGKRLYNSARKGKTVAVEARKVIINEFEITGIEMPMVHFRVKCSKGTYLRTLVYDFGKKLNSGAYLFSLRRTKIGDYNVDDALDIEDFINYIISKRT